jgi:hypothetical protein
MLAWGRTVARGAEPCRRLPAERSISAGKVNPVIPEAVTQVALRVDEQRRAHRQAAALGHLESLNRFCRGVNVALTESLVLWQTPPARCAPDGHTEPYRHEDRCAPCCWPAQWPPRCAVPLLGHERVLGPGGTAWQQEGCSELEVVRQEGQCAARQAGRTAFPNVCTSLAIRGDRWTGTLNKTTYRPAGDRRQATERELFAQPTSSAANREAARSISRIIEFSMCVCAKKLLYCGIRRDNTLSAAPTPGPKTA